uniref:RNA binding motif protein 6 n=1 Tax=Nothobranchius kuhntae TaxID=321403 RepID=A0A1A8KUP6_NOTKU
MGPLGPMGHMGPGHQDFHPMDRRRMDGPPMRGRDMDSRDMRGREPNRDFFRPGEEPDFSQRRQFEVCIGERMMDSSAFPGPGRDLEGMGGRDMPPWHPNDRFFDMRDRESFHHDMPRFNRPNFDERKGFPMNRMEPNDGFRDIHDRHPLDAECYDMNRLPHERRMTDIDGKGGPPLIPRGQFDSDMDFRSQPGPPPVELKERDRSPLRYGRSDVPSVDRERLDMPSEVGGPQSSEFMGSGDSANKDEYPDSSGSPVMDYRCGEEMTLAEEWKNRQKESYKRMGSETESKFPVGFSDGSNKSNPPTFSDIDKPSFPGKDDSFTHSDRFLAMGIPPVGNKGPQDLLPKGSLKLGTRTASMKYVQPDECKRDVHESDHKVPEPLESQLPRSDEPFEELNGSTHRHPAEQQSHTPWQRSSDLTPEAWQQQVDQQLQEQEELEQQAESLNSHDPHHRLKSVFSESKTMIIKNVKVTTTVETILKALDPFAYLDERNVRLVKGKPHAGKYGKSFCFVDMDSHEQVTRLVELLTKPKPLYIDGVRVHAEVARPLKNPNIRRDFDKQGALPPGILSEAGMIVMQLYPQPLHYLPPPLPHAGAPPGAVGAMPGDVVTGCLPPALPSDPSLSQGVDFGKTAAVAPVYSTEGLHVSPDAAGTTTTSTDGSQLYVCGSEVPDTSNYLFDSTSGFFYDPETTLYYDPNSRYFYNAQTQEYLYWDATLKTYIPVPGGHSAETRPATTMTAEDQAILSNPAADAPLEMKKPSEPPQASTAAAPVSVSAENSTEAGLASTAAPDKKEDDEFPKKDKEDKPRSIAAVKIMKDMERWAKIQNRQKDSVRAPSPVLRTEMEGEKKQSKSADAAFAIFERKISGGDELFKTPLTPAKKEEKSKRPMGSLGLLASDYGAGSDEEVEEDREEAAKSSQKSQPEEKGDKLTDWKKMACLLCRRQFPNKDALIRHQQLSDLHKQNMEIHLKIKRSKKELEALENQEKKLHSKEPSGSPEKKKRKHYHHHSHKRSNTRAGSSGETNQVSERPGLGAEPVQQQKKEPVVWDHTTYKQAVRKAMFARFKELE